MYGGPNGRLFIICMGACMRGPDLTVKAARGARRLRIAAVLMGIPASDDVLATISTLPEPVRRKLREHVAVVESYLAEEARFRRPPARVVPMPNRESRGGRA